MKFTFAPESRPLEGYTIKRAIYRGGFGEVYYALTDAGREVALKLLQNNTDVELRGVQQCLNLSHPNLVTIFDIRQDGDGDHWILMEYVAGETLDACLRRYSGGMPMEEIRRWLPGLSAGVSFLHDRGIVHRDLKPGNVFIENNVVKVGDVGLSKYIAPSKRSAHTQSVGTVYYMAPEVAKGKYGKEVDVYALGIMLYEMLCGHVPFNGESTGEILMKHLSAAPDLSVLPPRLQPVIARALEKDPARRFSSVAALAEAFERAVLGKTVVLDIPESSFVGAPAAEAIDPLGFLFEKGSVESPAGSAGSRPPFVKVQKANQPRVTHAHGDGMNPWLIFGFAGLLLTLFVGTPFLGIPALALIAYGTHRTAQSKAFVPQPRVEPPHTAPTRYANPTVDVQVRVETQRPGERPLHSPQAAKAQRAVLTPRTLRAIGARNRVTQFCESAALSALLISVFTAAIAMVAPEFFRSPDTQIGSVTPGLIGLFGGTALCGVWGLLGVSKLLEGRNIDLAMRRLITLLVGCVVGEAAWGLSEAFFVDLPERGSAIFASVSSNPLSGDLGPTWIGYMMFFGLLFGLRRWWWQADGYRPKRFRVMSVLVTMLLAWGLSAVFEFPHGWGIVWAGVMSSVVQLSSAWTPPSARIKG